MVQLATPGWSARGVLGTACIDPFACTRCHWKGGEAEVMIEGIEDKAIDKGPQEGRGTTTTLFMEAIRLGRQPFEYQNSKRNEPCHDHPFFSPLISPNFCVLRLSDRMHYMLDCASLSLPDLKGKPAICGKNAALGYQTGDIEIESETATLSGTPGGSPWSAAGSSKARTDLSGLAY
ncbi:hypothetical protein BC826DRAFT_968261 [Russula brevipes]|nr:hypothetical protein BC826DRAFT_968261 [Russula brevipes]